MKAESSRFPQLIRSVTHVQRVLDLGRETLLLVLLRARRRRAAGVGVGVVADFACR